MANLVNHFGQADNAEDIKIKPILVKKGCCFWTCIGKLKTLGRSRLSLYGLGSIRDERLHRTFLKNKVTFLKPPTTGVEDDWFHLMVIHQNRLFHVSDF